jgi:hypothetical protein
MMSSIALICPAGSASRLIASVARPIEAEIVCEPANKPAADPLVMCELGDRVGRGQTQDRDDNGKNRLWYAVSRDARHELRTDAISDREEEEQKEDRFDVRRDLNSELADQDCDEQRGGYGSKAEALDALAADPISESQREKERDLGILTQGFNEPRQTALPPERTSKLRGKYDLPWIGASVCAP